MKEWQDQVDWEKEELKYDLIEHRTRSCLLQQDRNVGESVEAPLQSSGRRGQNCRLALTLRMCRAKEDERMNACFMSCTSLSRHFPADHLPRELCRFLSL